MASTGITAIMLRRIHGKHYLIIEALGTSGKKHKIFCWNAPEGSSLRPYSVLAAQLQNGDYGFSTNWRRVRELGNKN